MNSRARNLRSDAVSWGTRGPSQGQKGNHMKHALVPALPPTYVLVRRSCPGTQGRKRDWSSPKERRVALCALLPMASEPGAGMQWTAWYEGAPLLARCLGVLRKSPPLKP